MSEVPDHLTYSRTHEWVAYQENATAVIGITAHAQQLLGDVVFVELPEVGAHLELGKEFGVIESVKAASDLYSPLTGEVIAVNEALRTNPALVNADPYEKGWIIKVRVRAEAEREGLMNAQAYQTHIQAPIE